MITILKKRQKYGKRQQQGVTYEENRIETLSYWNMIKRILLSFYNSS